MIPHGFLGDSTHDFRKFTADVQAGSRLNTTGPVFNPLVNHQFPAEKKAATGWYSRDFQTDITSSWLLKYPGPVMPFMNPICGCTPGTDFISISTLHCPNAKPQKFPKPSDPRPRPVEPLPRPAPVFFRRKVVEAFPSHQGGTGWVRVGFI